MKVKVAEDIAVSKIKKSGRTGVKVSEYNVSLDKVAYDIAKRINEFHEKYGIRPHYIKLSNWLYEKLMAYFITEFYKDAKTGMVTIYGLIACPTISIQEPDQFEVF